MSEMNWKHRALADRMSEISEGCYFAGWMTGNEYTLWEMVAQPSAPRCYGMGEVSESDVADLKAMSDEIGGWIRWVDDDEVPGLDVSEWGCQFITMAEWLPLYERRIKEWEALRNSLAQAKDQP